MLESVRASVSFSNPGRPTSGPSSLATKRAWVSDWHLGAVPVAARVVRRLGVAAREAHVQMPAQHGHAANARWRAAPCVGTSRRARERCPRAPRRGEHGAPPGDTATVHVARCVSAALGVSTAAAAADRPGSPDAARAQCSHADAISGSRPSATESSRWLWWRNTRFPRNFASAAVGASADAGRMSDATKVRVEVQRGGRRRPRMAPGHGRPWGKSWSGQVLTDSAFTRRLFRI